MSPSTLNPPLGRTKPVLLEDLQSTTLLKSDTRDGKVYVRGEFAICDTVTGNGRVYPSGIFAKALEEFVVRAREGKIFGHLDHPPDAKTKLKEASHLITDVRLEERDGRTIVFGEAIVLKNSWGNQLLSIIEAGGKVGVSSRGIGSVAKNSEGYDVVQNDFKLESFDFVADPANVNAYPQFFMEDRNKILGELSMDKMTLDDLKARNPELYKQLQKEAESQFEEWKQAFKESCEVKFKNDVLYALEKEQENLENKIREEMKLSSEVIGAQKVLNQIAGLLKSYVNSNGSIDVSEEVKAENKKLLEKLDEKERELAEAVNLIKDLGRRYLYALYVDNSPMASKLKEKLDKVEFVDFETFAKAIEEAKGLVEIKEKYKKEARHKISSSELEDTSDIADIEVDKEGEPAAKTEDAAADLSKLASRIKAKFARLRQEEKSDAGMSKERIKQRLREIKERRVVSSSSASTSNVKESKDSDLELYLYKMTDNHPARIKIRQMFDEGKISSKKELDLLLEAYGNSQVRINDLNEDVNYKGDYNVRSKSGSSFLLDGIEVDLESFRILSGMNLDEEARKKRLAEEKEKNS